MAKIAVDIDSTLYDFETPAREAFTKLAADKKDRTLLRGAYDPWTEWRSPADVCGLETWLEVIQMCHDDEVILDQTPFDGAVDTCLALAEAGHELLYISNRATESEWATSQWLKEWEFPIDGILVGEEYHGGHLLKVLTTDKKPLLANCQYLIDDRPKTVVDFIYDLQWQIDHCAMHDPNPNVLQRRAFVLAYPYNQALTDIPHLYLAPTWSGINSYLVSKGVLTEPAYYPLGT